MMPHGRGSPERKLGSGRPAQSRTRALMDVQVLKDEEKEAAANASSYASVGATTREEPGSGTPGFPQNIQGNLSPLTALGSTPRSQCCEGSSGQGEEGASSSQGEEASQITQYELLYDKLDKLLPFLLRKHQKKEQVTVEEMVHTVEYDYQAHCPLLFRELCECICLSFGIEMREVDALGRTYELVPILGLTFSGLLDNELQAIPKAELLIFILSIITAKGSRLSEEDLRELLRNSQVLRERKKVIGDLWKFLTEDLVQEEYLVYQQIPNSDPAHYELMWGPRAHAETTQVKMLQHIFDCDRTDPRSYPHLYEQAFRNDKDIFSAPEGQDE